MTFVFWQNMLSIHQSSFLRSLAAEHEVIVVAEEELGQGRIKEGWNIPNYGKAKVVLADDNILISRFLELENATHVFSGMNAYPRVHKAFKIAIKRNYNIGISSEPFEYLGLKGSVRALKYLFFRLRYGSSIKFILAIGPHANRCFRKVCFPTMKIFDWAYFTEGFTNSEKRSSEKICSKPN